jgi:AraC-like DNA-binding protein
MDHQGDGMIAACLETPEVSGDISEPMAERPSVPDDAEVYRDRDRDRSLTIDTILGLVECQAPDRQAHHSPGPPGIGALSRVSRQPSNSDPEFNFVAELSLAVNDALLGSPRRLERFLPADPTIEQLLRARSAANDMAKEPARLYLRFLYSAMLTWASARKTIQWSHPVTPLPKWRFARVRDYIDLHLEETIRLQDLAKAAGLSRMHFAAQFRAYTGISPSKFVLRHRIQQAQVLLGDPRKAVAEVAFSVGFRSQAHFTTVFHRFVGNTPNSWRKARSEQNTTVRQ